MAETYALKGTSYPSFRIGKKGPVVFQGKIAPDNSSGADGDLYIQHNSGSTSNFLYQRVNGVWYKMQHQHLLLDDIAALTPITDGTLGTNGTNAIVRTVEQQRSTLGLGTAALKDVGVSSGQLVELDANNQIPQSLLPPISISNVYAVDTISERDDLIVSPGVQTGDFAVVASNSISYVYDGSQWIAFAATLSVQAIQSGTVGVLKQGIVSLEASDILSGVFPEQRGGTGKSSYALGDLLVGNNASGLKKLTVGSNDQVLKIVSGDLSWQKQTANHVDFSPVSTQHLVSTNVQAAIEEVASERPYIHTAIVAPTVTDDNTANFKVGDIWIDTNEKRIYFAVNVSTGSANWRESSGGSSNLDLGTIVVSSSGNDDPAEGDGSLARPYATISHAISQSSPGDVVMIYPGVYVESLNPTKDIILYAISGGTTSSVEISGELTIGSYNFTSIGLKFSNALANCVTANILANKTIVFDNCHFIRANSTDIAVSIIGSVSSTNRLMFKECSVAGTINHNHSGVAYYQNCWGNNWQLTQTSSDSIVYINDTSSIKYVNHISGKLYINGLHDVIGISNDGIISSGELANNALLVLSNVNLRKSDDSGYLNINKSGTCNYVLNDVNRSVSGDTLTGTRAWFGRNGNDISGNHTPSNWTVTSGNLSDHFAGIDSKFDNLSLQELTDVPNFAGAGGDSHKFVKVNALGDGIEYLSIGSTSATSANQTLSASSYGQNFQYTGTTNATFTLPSASTLFNGWFVGIKNISSTNGVTLSIITQGVDTINGVSSVVLRNDEGLVIYCDGSRFDVYSPPEIRSILELDDTPDTHVADKFLKANSTGTAIEYASTISTSDITGLHTVATSGNFLDLNDTFSTFSGHSLKVLRVNTDGTAVEPSVVLGTAAIKDTGVASGQIPILDGNGKLDVQVMPAVSITQVYVVASIAERDALTVNTGDVVRVTDIQETYMWDGTGYISITSPDLIQSVNSQTGDVLLRAEHIPFNIDATNRLSGTNVQDAITELASERPWVEVSTVAPTATDDSSLNFKQGDIWINTNDNRVYFALGVNVGNAKWEEAGNVSPLDGLILVKSGSDDAKADGSWSRPYGTLGSALSAAPTNATILLAPGTYNENVTLSKNVNIIGLAQNPVDAIINGQISLSNTSGIYIRHIRINATSVAALAIASTGDVYVEKCSLRTTGTNAVTTSGTSTTTYELDDCSITGALVCGRTGGTLRVIKNSNANNVTATSGENVDIVNCDKIGSISHGSGKLFIKNVARIASLNSTATTVLHPVVIENSSFLDSDNNYTTLQLDSGTYYLLKDVTYNPSTSLGANRIRYAQNASDITVNYIAGNYDAGDTGEPKDVKGHFMAVDTKLGLKLESIQQDSAPKLGGNLDVNGFQLTSSSNGNITISPHGTGRVDIAGVTMEKKTTVGLTNNQIIAQTVYSFDKVSDAVYVDYGIQRGTNGSLGKRIGTLLITNDGTSVVHTDTGVEMGDTGISLSTRLSGSTIFVEYTSNDLGATGTFTYSVRKFTI